MYHVYTMYDTVYDTVPCMIQWQGLQQYYYKNDYILNIYIYLYIYKI